MARYRDASCRLCRREGTKLFLKGAKCATVKCPFGRRSYAPGEHGKKRVKISDYGRQLREKQKVKKIYGVLEKQFKFYFKNAAHTKGVTGHILLQTLERRLDNVVFRMGLAASRPQARQIVHHGHITVNDKKIDVPSYLIKAHDGVKIVGKQEYLDEVRKILEQSKDRELPSWLHKSQDGLSSQILRLPQRDDIKFPIQEQLIVELYSK